MLKSETHLKTLITKVYLIKPRVRVTLIYVLLLALVCCKNNPQATIGDYKVLRGNTMGTTYNLVFLDEEEKVKAQEIDELLAEINQAVSTYIESSSISRFNAAEKEFVFDTSALSQHFISNFEASWDIYRQSNGQFDPTCMGLVNYWGFGYKHKKALENIDTLAIKDILVYTGFNKLYFNNNNNFAITKEHSEIQLDFSAIAKGYGVDKVLDYLVSKGVKHALVEIGGETKSIGKNRQGKRWRVGVNTPSPQAKLSDYQEVVLLNDMSLASSGNYRNYYEIDGKRYGHEIDPKTGFPKDTEILSASILSKSCMYADGYATACMVMDIEDALNMIESADGVEALFILGDDTGYKKVMTTGFGQYLMSK